MILGRRREGGERKEEAGKRFGLGRAASRSASHRSTTNASQPRNQKNSTTTTKNRNSPYEPRRGRDGPLPRDDDGPALAPAVRHSASAAAPQPRPSAAGAAVAASCRAVVAARRADPRREPRALLRVLAGRRGRQPGGASAPGRSLEVGNCGVGLRW